MTLILRCCCSMFFLRIKPPITQFDFYIILTIVVCIFTLQLSAKYRGVLCNSQLHGKRQLVILVSQVFSYLTTSQSKTKTIIYEVSICFQNGLVNLLL